MNDAEDYQPVFRKDPDRFRDFALPTLLFITGQPLREIVRHSEQLILLRFDILQLQFGASEQGCSVLGPAYPDQKLITQQTPIALRPEFERLQEEYTGEQVKAIEILSSPDKTESVGLGLILKEQTLTFYRDGSRASVSVGRIPNVTQTFFNNRTGPSAIYYHIYPYQSMTPEEYVAKTRHEHLIGSPLTTIQAGGDVAPEDPLYKWVERVAQLLLDY